MTTLEEKQSIINSLAAIISTPAGGGNKCKHLQSKAKSVYMKLVESWLSDVEIKFAVELSGQ